MQRIFVLVCIFALLGSCVHTSGYSSLKNEQGIEILYCSGGCELPARPISPNWCLSAQSQTKSSGEVIEVCTALSLSKFNTEIDENKLTRIHSLKRSRTGHLVTPDMFGLHCACDLNPRRFGYKVLKRDRSKPRKPDWCFSSYDGCEGRGGYGVSVGCRKVTEPFCRLLVPDAQIPTSARKIENSFLRNLDD